MVFNALMGGSNKSKTSLSKYSKTPKQDSAHSIDTPSSNHVYDKFSSSYMDIFEASQVDNANHPVDPKAVEEALCRILPVLPPSNSVARSKELVNEGLLIVRVASFEILNSSNTSLSLQYSRSIRTDESFQHFVCIVRSTNRPLRDTENGDFANTSTAANSYDGKIMSEANDTTGGYDDMFNPDSGNAIADLKNENVSSLELPSLELEENHTKIRTTKTRTHDAKENHPSMDNAKEVSSFPRVVLVRIHSNGKTLDIHHMVGLDRIMTLESSVDTGHSQKNSLPSRNKVKMVFDTGDVITVDFMVSLTDLEAEQESVYLCKERFLWALLELHVILCTMATEQQYPVRDGSETALMPSTNRLITHSVPPLAVVNIDRSELQFLSTVYGFLNSIPSLHRLLQLRAKLSFMNKDGMEQNMHHDLKGVEGIAQDLMMGGHMSRMNLFANSEERKHATEIFNALTKQWNYDEEQKTDYELISTINEEDECSFHNISQLLHKKTRDLEAEMCRRLIAWEDEKQVSLAFGSKGKAGNSQKPGVDSFSLISLMQVLDNLDLELKEMDDWLEDKAISLKPTFDDCSYIETENRRLQQSYTSYDLLQAEIRDLMDSIDIPKDVEDVLRHPSSRILRDYSGKIELEQAKGLEVIIDAGRILKECLDKTQQEGGIHLRALNEKVRGLISLSSLFCDEVVEIIVELMKRIASELSQETISSRPSHTSVFSAIRDNQKKYQKSLLNYMKLIEIVTQLRPHLLPKLRNNNAEIVLCSYFSKETMNMYFSTLPSKASPNDRSINNALKDYDAIGLPKGFIIEAGTADTTPVASLDISIALADLLGVVAREAFFTALLFGNRAENLSGKEKKKNFYAVKKSVDVAIKHFKSGFLQLCDIFTSESDTIRKGNPILCSVASLYLQEAHDEYRSNKKVSDQTSLSYAYVRSIILGIKKEIDTVWVAWVENQIKWIRSHPGVSSDGKQVGVFSSFARFPSYLDHLMTSYSTGKPENSTLSISKSKVVSHYLQKMAGALFSSLQDCASSESSNQQVASNVMRIENAYFFTQSLKRCGSELNEVLQKQITAAHEICKQSTDAYLVWMLRREFKPLHSLFGSINKIRREVGDSDVAIHIPRATFEKILHEEARHEILTGKITRMYELMSTHLSPAGGMLPILWKALVKVLHEWFGRWEKVSTQCYKVVLQPSAVDVVKVAKLVSGLDNRRHGSHRSSSKLMI